MTAVLALLGLIAAPLMCWLPSRRVARRARAAGLRNNASREDVKAVVRAGEAYTVVGGLLVAAASVAALCVLAVLG